ncbi:hypothetical protein AMK16_18715 [Streptomyces sp. CB00455]|uniref:hypothetical protein n=1 Tax=Streptomyces sp. CB00455 TaxID=1703927 RepID=UPI00093F0192|nr:hypothetical protein [Streptomyces sp. CB00455]OKK18357.1 hypothetical protein AMK16_18715 [Streptomyces sp. CB00455]
MTVSTVLILSVVVAIITALVLAPSVAVPRAGAGKGRRGLRAGQALGRHRDTGPRGDGPRRLRTVPQQRSPHYRRTGS